MKIPESLNNLQFKLVLKDEFNKKLKEQDSLFIEYNKPYKIYCDESHNIFGYVIDNGFTHQYFLLK